jgi:hypothetical protein
MPHRCFRNQLALLQTFKILQPGRRASPIDTAISDISREYHNQYGEAVRASETKIFHTCRHQTSVDCSDGRISGSSSEERHRSTDALRPEVASGQ